MLLGLELDGLEAVFLERLRCRDNALDLGRWVGRIDEDSRLANEGTSNVGEGGKVSGCRDGGTQGDDGYDVRGEERGHRVQESERDG